MKETMYLNHKGHKEKLLILINFAFFVNFVVNYRIKRRKRGR